MTAVAIAFWLSAGLIVYTHLGYPLALWVLVHLRGRTAGGAVGGSAPAGASATAGGGGVPGATGTAGEALASCDANSLWQPDAVRQLAAPFADPAVGYACGQVRFLDAGGGNLEGAYWRYEMAVREMEAGAGGVPGGDGAV